MFLVFVFDHHHHHMSVMELGHLLTRSGLTYLEVSSEVCHDSFCQLVNSVSLSCIFCHEAFCLYVVCSSSYIPVVYLLPVLFLILLQCVNLFCNLPKCILLFFSYISFTNFSFKHLNTSGDYMYHMMQHSKVLHFAPREHLIHLVQLSE